MSSATMEGVQASSRATTVVASVSLMLDRITRVMPVGDRETKKNDALGQEIDQKIDNE